MKLEVSISRRSRYVLGAGACIVALAIIGTMYSRQTQEQDQLNKELDAAQARLAAVSSTTLSARQSDLDAQLISLQADIESFKSQLSPEVISPDISDALFATAREKKVEITSLSSNSRANSEVENVPGLILPLTLSVKGNVPSMLSFVSELGVKFPTGVVRAVDLTIHTGNVLPSANINLDIYAYKGD
ncbi:MAG: hypothetical protein HYX84_06220 [Chloroflexi bacterium]|nr:hypothetical protein [Chloroflexota bacterium]